MCNKNNNSTFIEKEKDNISLNLENNQKCFNITTDNSSKNNSMSMGKMDFNQSETNDIFSVSNAKLWPKLGSKEII